MLYRFVFDWVSWQSIEWWEHEMLLWSSETMVKTLNRHMFKVLPIISVIIAIAVISDKMSPTIQ